MSVGLTLRRLCAIICLLCIVVNLCYVALQNSQEAYYAAQAKEQAEYQLKKQEKQMAEQAKKVVDRSWPELTRYCNDWKTPSSFYNDHSTDRTPIVILSDYSKEQIEKYMFPHEYDWFAWRRVQTEDMPDLATTTPYGLTNLLHMECDDYSKKIEDPNYAPLCKCMIPKVFVEILRKAH